MKEAVGLFVLIWSKQSTAYVPHLQQEAKHLTDVNLLFAFINVKRTLQKGKEKYSSAPNKQAGSCSVTPNKQIDQMFVSQDRHEKGFSQSVLTATSRDGEWVGRNVPIKC